MSRYINPFTDYGFKRIFGEEANKDLLLDFLNALEVHKYIIKELTFRKTEKLGNSSLDRKAFFDLYCVDEKGNRFIIELQKVEQKFFKDRALYYTTFAVQEQAEKGEWDYELTGIYFIGILDFELVGEKHRPNKYKHDVMLVELEEKSIFYDKLKYVYLEIPKFNKKEADLVTNLDKWLYFLKYLSKLEDRPDTFNNEMFIKAFKLAEMINMDSDRRIEYEASLKSYRDLKVILNESFVKGKLEGIEEGNLKTSRNYVKKLLNKKLRAIPEHIEKRIELCNSLEIFDKIADNIFDINSYTDLDKFF